MKAFFRTFFAALLAIVVVLAIGAGALKSKLDQKVKIKDHSYLVVDIYGEITEYCPPGDALSSVMGGKPETLQRTLDNLKKVRVDDRIDGVIMKISASTNIGVAKMEEMRNAIKKVRDAGKPVYAFTDNVDKKVLYLASACDSVYLAPGGYVSFMGFAVTSTHVKKMMDKLGIKPNVHKIKEYKAAAELVMRENLSPEARENREWLLNEIWDITMAGVSEGRGLTEAQLIGDMEYALFTPKEAKEHGLVDELLYWPELERRLMRKGDEKLRTVCQARYAQEKPEKFGLKGKKKIAVIHAQGTIGGRTNQVHPLLGIMMGHETMCAALNKARLDDDVAGVVFRIDSGGGESLTSDIISHAVDILADEKPVVCSMVDVAASGGYMIAYRGTKIMADQSTITGSIGSISAKFNMKEFYAKLGITFDHVTKGPMAMLMAEDRDFTEAEWKRFTDNHWADFNTWLRDVANRRGMTFEEAQKLAYGRVWSGRQAKANGLIDEIGDLDDAIAMVKSLADIPEDEQVTVVHYPKEKDLLSTIFGGGDMAATVRMIAYRLLHDQLSESLSRAPAGYTYMMDPVTVE